MQENESGCFFSEHSVYDLIVVFRSWRYLSPEHVP